MRFSGFHSESFILEPHDVFLYEVGNRLSRLRRLDIALHRLVEVLNFGGFKHIRGAGLALFALLRDGAFVDLGWPLKSHYLCAPLPCVCACFGRVV